MKRQVIGLGIAVGSLVVALALPSWGIEPEAKKIAENLSIVGVKDLEVYANTTDYCARVTIEFMNKGAQAVKLENGAIEIFLAPKEGQRRTAVGARPEDIVAKPETEKEVTIVGTDGKEQKVKQIVTPIREIDTKEVKFGDARIGENENALVFKAATDGKPTTFDRPIIIRIGDKNDPATTKTIVSMANIMGDPKTKFNMRLIVNTKVALGIKEGSWISDDHSTKVELNLSPSADQQYLFK